MPDVNYKGSPALSMIGAFTSTLAAINLHRSQGHEAVEGWCAAGVSRTGVPDHRECGRAGVTVAQQNRSNALFVGNLTILSAHDVLPLRAMFKPIESADDLPQIDVACEKATLDFKVKPTTDAFEAAKDVAAFANAAGGTLLIGAHAVGEVVNAYVPLTPADASAAQRFYEQQGVRNRCHPRPFTTVAHIPQGAGIVLAINVWPFIGQPVGVEVKKLTGVSLPQDLYSYPVRVGSHTSFILPEQMHMFVDAKFRRVALGLQGCQRNGGKLTLFGYDETSPWITPCRICHFADDGNAVVLEFDYKSGSKKASLPIDYVQSIWCDPKGWKAKIPGYVDEVIWSSDADQELKENDMIFFDVLPLARRHKDREQKVRVVDFPRQPSVRHEATRFFRALRRRLTR